MTSLLHFFILLPALGFILSLLVSNKNEKLLSGIAFSTVGIHFAGAIAFIVYWLLNEHQTLTIKYITLYSAKHYAFFINFYFDEITAVYLFVGSFLTYLVTVYSKYYLHREAGYKRFYNTILLFYVGYTIAIFSGNLETLFIGWEILGISSFLLIAFYRDRYLPVKNAIKVFSIYRIGDVGLILAMWAAHHFFHTNITFNELTSNVLVQTMLAKSNYVVVFISLMILLAAIVKSAQLPFSSWLPRAMEGPTPSSAIFYGSLSVHLGVFLLLRTFPLWEHQTVVRIIIVVIGLSTSIVTTLIARVQSSVKSQIAYASIAQIGILFIEIALGFHTLALVHFAGNAFLRTYQLLVSPSAVSYLIKEQFYNFVPRALTIEDSWPKRIEYSLYILSIKEWNLDTNMYRYLWSPLKKIANTLHFLTLKRTIYLFVIMYTVGILLVYNVSSIPTPLLNFIPNVFAFIGLLLVLKSFAERWNVNLSWLLIIMNHFFIALAISFNEQCNLQHIFIYLSGVVVAGTLGYVLLTKLKKAENNIDLNQFYGYSYEHPKLAFLFLLACLGLAGFPITPTFVGEDLLYSHIHPNQFMLVLFVSLSIVVDGLALIRIYARLFLGTHVKTTHERAYKSS
ncbi:MAG: proton-conducting transporter membrane subunit [Bacteroidia bacterium]